jgi:raffinose/stachyose/melibiose transport system permease protein
MEHRYNWRTLSLEIFMILLACIFFVPFYFVLVNSVKSLSAIMLGAGALPEIYLFSNFTEAWNAIAFPKVLLNSVIVNIFSVTGLVVIGSMAAWRLARFPGKLSTVLLILFISAMIIPFQSIMIPLVQFTKWLGLINSIQGLIIMYFGFGSAFTIFLFHGFIKTVPVEVEEAAIMDGCSDLKLFWRIVFPLLKPMVATAIILNSLWIWNDFLLPLLVLQNKELHTIPLAVYSFFALYSKKWGLAMATLLMSIAPILLLFLVLQKHIIRGVASGSVKG